jgi:hypothetical protein
MTKSIVLSGVFVLGVGAVSVLAQSGYDQQRYDPNRPYEQDVRTTYVGDADYDLPAFVSVVDGYAELDRDGQSSRDIENVPLEAGDRLRTTRGRVEVLFDDGSVLALDEHTAVTFVSASDMELVAGRVRAQWRDRAGRTGLSIHTVAGSAIIRTQGDYRITLAESRRGDAEIEVAVARGSAELANDHGRTIVREGTRALTTAGYAPSTPYAYSAPRDTFERWTEELERDRYGIESARYLPDELRYYGGVFDRYGAWQRHPSYGYVWYPRVSVGWRPYDGGRWSFVIGFGYSWVGGSRWSWPTHHHGRWDRVGGAISGFRHVPRSVGLWATRHRGLRTPRRSTTIHAQRCGPHVRNSPARSRRGRRTRTARRSRVRIRGRSRSSSHVCSAALSRRRGRSRVRRRGQNPDRSHRDQTTGRNGPKQRRSGGRHLRRPARHPHRARARPRAHQGPPGRPTTAAAAARRFGVEVAANGVESDEWP